MNLYEIRERALHSGRAVFDIQQLANLIGISKAVAKVYAHRLVKKSLAKPLLRGKISFVNDDLVIATQLIEPSYISGYSALLFHDLIEQVPRYTEAITTKRSILYKELGIRYYKVQPKLFYGYNRYKKDQSYVFVAEPEKALIDGLYLGTLPKTLIEELKPKLKSKQLIAYIKRFEGRGKKKLERLLL